MSSSVDLLLVMVLLLNFFMLGTSRVHGVIQCAAAQGVLLGVLLVVVHGDVGVRTVALAAVAIGLKAVLIPGMLRRAMRQGAIRREVEPLVSLVSSLVLAAAGTGLAILLADRLPLAPEHADSLVVHASLATVLTGFLVLTTRRKAITQVVG